MFGPFSNDLIMSPLVPQATGLPPRGGIAGASLWLIGDVDKYQDTGGATPATSNGNLVQLWKDQSGNANNATHSASGRDPQNQNGIQNGKAVCRFDGTDDELNLTTPLNLSAFTAYVVSRTSNIAGSNIRYLAGDTGANNGGIVMGGESGFGYGLYDGTNLRDANEMPTTCHLFTLQAAHLWKNGVEATYSNSGTPTALFLAAVGSRKSAVFPFVGDIMELLVHPSVHDGTTRLAVETAIKAYWGTP